MNYECCNVNGSGGSAFSMRFARAKNLMRKLAYVEKNKIKNDK